MKRSLPPSASVANQAEEGRLVAPAASRNVDVLRTLVQAWAPAKGHALEIASGTGQHISAFAGMLPQLFWQPTEIEADRRSSIDTYAAALTNVANAAYLDATKPGWHQEFGGYDLIILVNLLHLISWNETETLVSETARALNPKGRFIIYGPFKRAGQLTSTGDQKFHDALVHQDPEIGYKNDADIAELLGKYRLGVLEVVSMPANNLAFMAQNADE